MTEQITLDEALKLVSFKRNNRGDWAVDNIDGDVYGDVYGDVCGDVYGNVVGDVVRDVYGDVCGNVRGDVDGNVGGDVCGNVYGTIRGQSWKFIETPKAKLQRLIKKGADKEELIKAINQLEDN